MSGTTGTARPAVWPRSSPSELAAVNESLGSCSQLYGLVIGLNALKLEFLNLDVDSFEQQNYCIYSEYCSEKATQIRHYLRRMPLLNLGTGDPPEGAFCKEKASTKYTNE